MTTKPIWKSRFCQKQKCPLVASGEIQRVKELLLQKNNEYTTTTTATTYNLFNYIVKFQKFIFSDLAAKPSKIGRLRYTTAHK